MWHGLNCAVAWGGDWWASMLNGAQLLLAYATGALALWLALGCLRARKDPWLQRRSIQVAVVLAGITWTFAAPRVFEPLGDRLDFMQARDGRAYCEWFVPHLEAYRERTGHYPERLDELQPNPLPKPCWRGFLHVEYSIGDYGPKMVFWIDNEWHRYHVSSRDWYWGGDPFDGPP